MKTFVLFAYLCFFSFLSMSAQQFSRIFLFDEFAKAQITFRNRTQATVSLNYDVANKKMLYTQGDDLMEVTNIQTVDTIFVKGHKFIPEANVFYEVVPLTNGIVYIDWLIKDVNIGSKGALGAVTQGSVHNLQMSNLGLNAVEMYTPYKQQELGSTDLYQRKSDNTYFIRKNNKYIKFKTIKQLNKAFPESKDKINTFVKENDIDMKETRDALIIINYCLGL